MRFPARARPSRFVFLLIVLALLAAAGARALRPVDVETVFPEAHRRGELIVGVSYAPCWNGGRGEIIFAEKGRGAWLGEERLEVSAVNTLAKATLSTGNLATLAKAPQWMELGKLIPQLHRIRGYGDFLHYHMLANGKLDAVVESDVNILDIAALVVIVREAGGTFTDINGGPVGLETTTVLATNSKLHHLFSSLALG